MSKTETPKISVTKRDAKNGDIPEQIQFVSDVRERITNLKMEAKVDDGGKKSPVSKRKKEVTCPVTPYVPGVMFPYIEAVRSE
jgi:hypothetical protein